MRIPTLKIEGNDDGSSQLANIRATQEIIEDWYYDEYGHEPSYEFEYQSRGGTMLVIPVLPKFGQSNWTKYDQEDFFQGAYVDLTQLADYLMDNYPVDADVLFL